MLGLWPNLSVIANTHTATVTHIPLNFISNLKKKCCLILSNTRNYSENVVISCRELDNLQMLWQVNNLGLSTWSYLKQLCQTTSGHLIRWCHVFCFCRLEVYSLRQFSWSPFHMDANVIFLCTCGLTTGEVLTVGLPPSSNTLLGTGLEDCVDALVGQAWGG